MINSRETTRETDVAPKGKGVPKLSGKGLNLDELSGEREYAYRRRNLSNTEVKNDN